MINVSIGFETTVQLLQQTNTFIFLIKLYKSYISKLQHLFNSRLPKVFFFR